MARKKGDGVTQKVKKWWETDSAKAVAAVIAVSLIPVAIIAWNYASNADVEDELQFEVVEDSEGEEASEDSDNEEMADDEDDQDSEQPEQEEQKEEDQEQAQGGLEKIETLPDTSSLEYYTVRKGDSVYSISQTVCGDDSFYVNNLRKNYLKDGQTLLVTCE